MMSLLQQVGRIADSHHAECIAEIRLEIGPLSGVEPLLLHEAFLRLRAGTAAASANLVIDHVGLTCRCTGCQLTFTTDNLQFKCPDCGIEVDVLSGDCVLLQSITIHDATGATAS